MINREFPRFIFWGAINTAVGYLVYVALLRVFPYLVSYTIAFIVNVCLSYFLTSRFVFKEKMQLGKAAKYPSVYVIQYLIGIVTLYLLVQVVRIDKLWAPLIVVLITIPITYLLSRRIIQGKSKSRNNDPRTYTKRSS